MKIRIISVGKIREPFYNSGIQEYVKRLRPYSDIQLQAVLKPGPRGLAIMIYNR